MTKIQKTELNQVLRRRLGLIVGPRVTNRDDLDSACATALGVPEPRPPAHYLAIAEGCLAGGLEEADLRARLRSVIESSAGSMAAKRLATLSWSAVLSATPDSHLESELKKTRDRYPSRPPVAEICPPMSFPPPNCLPIFKLLGGGSADGLVASMADYRVVREREWGRFIREFADRVQDAAVLVVGMESSAEILLDIVAKMHALPTTTPTYFLFLGDDPLLNDEALLRQLRGRPEVLEVDASLAELAKVIEARERDGYAPLLPFTTAYAPSGESLVGLAEHVVAVDEQLVPQLKVSESQALQEVLYSPAIARWDPFCHELDFPRDASSVLLGRSRAALDEKEFRSLVGVLKGSAVSGKSTILKRIAFDLAKEGYRVLWLKPSLTAMSTGTLDKLMREESAALKSRSKTAAVVICADDALALSTPVGEVLTAARRAGLPSLSLLAIRDSEWGTLDEAARETLTGGTPADWEHSLPDYLSESEWISLPEYLVRLGVAGEAEEAESLLKEAASRSARDVLGLLYWLLPGTRDSIRASVRDEYWRLGAHEGLTKVVLGAMEKNARFVQEAYRMVAIAEVYGLQLPLEILVGALGVPYAEWVEVAVYSDKLWGLLYGSQSDEEATVYYRTRNKIVAQILREQVNGGPMSRSGEVAVLQRLLEACVGTRAVYHDFACRLLIGNDQLASLSYEEGDRLYQAAMSALPAPDKALLHHHGRWIRRQGKDIQRAIATLELALGTQPYPYGERGEANEHIHTSLAAAYVDGIVAGSIDSGTGSQAALLSLRRARSERFFNPRAVHVQANLIIELVRRTNGVLSPDGLSLLGEGLAEIDRTLIVLRSSGWYDAPNDEEMLGVVRSRLLEDGFDDATLLEAAERQWEATRSQSGFVVVLRRLLERARRGGKAKGFRPADEYARSCLRRIGEESLKPAPRLAEALAHLHYEWHLQYGAGSRSSYNIDWAGLDALASIALGDPVIGNGLLLRHIVAVSAAHQGDWSRCRALQRASRVSGAPNRVLWPTRDYLLRDTGEYRLVQGVVRRTGESVTVTVEELATDFRAAERDHWPNAGQVVHVYVSFAFAGDFATMRKPRAAK